MHFRKEKKLIIFGINDFAEIAYEYFMHDSAYEVMAFTVDRAYATCEKKFGLPVIPFEEIDQILPPAEHEIFAAVWYSDMNRLRRGVLEKARAKQYRLASYISSKAEIWHDAQIGEHCFILENCIVQPFAVIGENVVIWSGSHIGHHVRIGSHSFFSSGVILSGHSSVGSHCFVGVNCAFSNYAQVGEGSWINYGACVAGMIPPQSFVRSPQTSFTKLNEKALFRAISHQAALAAGKRQQ